MNPADTERLTRLEERYAHLQRHQAEQDKVMLELAEELARVKQELAVLRAQSSPGPSASRSEDVLPDERPPHY
ncbi:MAG: SlyX protein [Opitutus sp.]|nr:SlyX protein [Opitutus sp.]